MEEEEEAEVNPRSPMEERGDGTGSEGPKHFDNQDAGEGEQMKGVQEPPNFEEVLSGKWARREVPVFDEGKDEGEEGEQKEGDYQREGKGSSKSLQMRGSSGRSLERNSTSRLLSNVADANHDEVIRAIELRAQTAKELQKIRRNVTQLMNDYEKEEARFLATVTLLYPAPKARSKNGKTMPPAPGTLRRRDSVVSNNRTKMESLLTEYNFRSSAVTTALSQLLEWCGDAEVRDELIAHGFKDEDDDEESWTVDEIRTVRFVCTSTLTTRDTLLERPTHTTFAGGRARGAIPIYYKSSRDDGYGKVAAGNGA